MVGGRGSIHPQVCSKMDFFDFAYCLETPFVTTECFHRKETVVAISNFTI